MNRPATDINILNPFSDWETNFKSIVGEEPSVKENELLGSPFPSPNITYPKPTVIPNARADFWEEANDLDLEVKDTNEIEEDHDWPIQEIGEIITPEQKLILQKYHDWKLDLVSQNWEQELQTLKDNQEKHTDYDLINNELGDWKKAFPSTNPLILLNDYNKIKANQLPSGLPTNWKDLLDIFPEFPTTSTAQQIRTKYDELKGTTLTTDQQEAINNYQKIKDALKPWTDLFGTETAQQIKAKLDTKISPEEQGKINNYDKVKDDLDLWTKTFPLPNTPPSVKVQVDRFLMIMKLEKQRLQELNKLKP